MFWQRALPAVLVIKSFKNHQLSNAKTSMNTNTKEYKHLFPQVLLNYYILGVINNQQAGGWVLPVWCSKQSKMISTRQLLSCTLIIPIFTLISRAKPIKFKQNGKKLKTAHL